MSINKRDIIGSEELRNPCPVPVEADIKQLMPGFADVRFL